MGIEVEIRREGDSLVFIQFGARSPLVVVAEDRIRLEAADIDMVASRMENGEYTFMDVNQAGTRFTAERFEFVEGGRDYSTIVGEYRSDELNVTYRLLEGEEGLRIQFPPDRETPVFMLDDDHIRTTFGTLTLEREGGRVVAFTVDAGRARGLVYRRVGG